MKTNADMNNADIKKLCQLEPDTEQLLEQAITRLDLSARAYMRILKVARTIADLAQSQRIKTPHLSEALQYRNRPAG